MIMDVNIINKKCIIVNVMLICYKDVVLTCVLLSPLTSKALMSNDASQ